MHYALLGGCYAAGVFALDYAGESLGEIGVDLINALAVFDNAYSYLGSNESENIKV